MIRKATYNIKQHSPVEKDNNSGNENFGREQYS